MSKVKSRKVRQDRDAQIDSRPTARRRSSNATSRLPFLHSTSEYKKESTSTLHDTRTRTIRHTIDIARGEGTRSPATARYDAISISRAKVPKDRKWSAIGQSERRRPKPDIRQRTTSHFRTSKRQRLTSDEERVASSKRRAVSND